MKLMGLITVAVALILQSQIAQAAGDTAFDADDESFFGSISRSPAGLSRNRSYTGYRDEQPLEIQASLPQPARSIDGSMPTVTHGDDDDDATDTPPASD